MAEQVFDAACIVVASGHALVKMLIDTTEDEMDALWRVHVRNPVSAIRLISFFHHTHVSNFYETIA
ncbi:hypothetical protein HF394_00005 [Planococcus glaciei]|uniref:Uncharacterized protein n=1 Tax=Planococcus glaciei TaxID=459472 RepID=A0A7H8QF19_9BACL|nr:hypothetical protein [Planococcus glaciei]QDY46783.1 hypothetical protein FK545_00005 [Planococcus glaciei]QKX52547.1 hypothetical protein HF394_00005 [Planococcus glaciei]